MKRLTLIIAIVCIFVLFLIGLLSTPRKVSSSTELDNLQQNQKLIIKGKVIKETLSKNKKTLYLDNNLSAVCEGGCPLFLGKNISAIAILERYNNKNYLKILKINLS